MNGGERVPSGFRVENVPAGTLIVDRRYFDAAIRLGLDRETGWRKLLARGAGATGRAATATIELTGDLSMRIKPLRRGGWVAPMWRDRFVGTRRLHENLALAVDAAERGIPTPRAIALLTLMGPPGLYRGWLAVEEIAEAQDLRSRYTSGTPPTREELTGVLRTVRRMHDLGLEHRDLNLGNLLLRCDTAVEPRVVVVDLDAARLHRSALGFRLRQAAVRRLERSHAKITGLRGQAAGDPWYELYAGDDPDLARRLARGRRTGRFLLALHRARW